MNEDSGPTRLQITKTRAWGKTELGLPLSSEEMTQASACAPELSPVRGRLPWWGSGKMWGEGSQPAQKRSGFSEERCPWFSSSHPSPAHCLAQQPTSPPTPALLTAQPNSPPLPIPVDFLSLPLSPMWVGGSASVPRLPQGRPHTVERPPWDFLRPFGMADTQQGFSGV